MGRTVSRSGQISKSQSLISCAIERQRDAYNTIQALESFTQDSDLSGEAYSNAKGYVQSILLPVNKALCMSLEGEISANKEVVNCCNTHLSGVNLLDEDTLLNEISRLQRRINSLQDDWWDFLSPINPLLRAHYNSQIDKLKRELEKLDAYDNATQGLHDSANSQMDILAQKIGSIFSPSLFAGNRFHYSGINMDWANKLASQWDKSDRSMELRTEYIFKENLQKEFGFDEETVEIMWQVYEALGEKYPNASRLELDWRFTRLLGGFHYDKGEEGKAQWNDTAGCAIDQYVEKLSGSGNDVHYVRMSEEEYFVDFLGIERNAFLLLRHKVRLQHIMVTIKADSSGTIKLPETIKKNLIGEKNMYIQCAGIEWSDDDFLTECEAQYATFQRKGDFAHQQITTSAILAQQLGKDGFFSNFGALKKGRMEFWNNKKVTEKAGWLGDATIGSPPSFGSDDYISDLDATNISTYMSARNISYVDASNQYYRDLYDGHSRATIFLKDTPLSDVKKMIYDDLVYWDIKVQRNMAIESRDIDKFIELSALLQDETYAAQQVKKTAPDTYRFIKSLEEEAPLMLEDAQ